MSMTEVIHQLAGKDWSKIMNPPLAHNGQAYISHDKNNNPFVTCPHCGKRQFPIEKDTVIRNMSWKCKASDCRKKMVVNIGG